MQVNSHAAALAVWAYALARLPELLPRDGPAPPLLAPSPQPRVDAAALQFGEQLVRILVGVVFALFIPAMCCALPLPADPNDRAPGRWRASATSSPIVFAGTDG